MSRQRVPNLELAADTARANLLVNGGFEIWQRGAGPFTVQGAYGPDRWSLALGSGGAMSVSRDTANAAPGSTACAAVVYTHGSVVSDLLQNHADLMAQLRGKTVTFSAMVKCSTANAIRLVVHDGSTPANSSFHSGSGAYELLSATLPIATGSSGLNPVRFNFNASCTAYIDNAMLVVGSVPADYAPLHPADDLARCLRYYERFDAFNTQAICASMAYNAANTTWILPLKVTKGATPSTTFSAMSTFSVLSSGAGIIAVTNMTLQGNLVDRIQGSSVSASGLVAGNASQIISAAGQVATIVVEANP